MNRITNNFDTIGPAYETNRHNNAERTHAIMDLYQDLTHIYQKLKSEYLTLKNNYELIREDLKNFSEDNLLLNEEIVLLRKVIEVQETERKNRVTITDEID